jgi:hypothetical protein
MLTDSDDSEEIIERVAALDIGKAELVACVRVPHPDKPGRRAQEITTYSTMTRSLLGLAERLRALGVSRVVMEATSDYWKPVFYLLEAHGLDPWLVNAKDVKHLPGRPKTDRLDAIWLSSRKGFCSSEMAAFISSRSAPKSSGRASLCASGGEAAAGFIWQRAVAAGAVDRGTPGQRSWHGGGLACGDHQCRCLAGMARHDRASSSIAWAPPSSR